MANLLQSFSNVKSVGDGAWMATCPAHDDSTPSLSIGRAADGKWLLKCHAGCELDSILGGQVTMSPRRLAQLSEMASPSGHGRKERICKGCAGDMVSSERTGWPMGAASSMDQMC